MQFALSFLLLVATGAAMAGGPPSDQAAPMADMHVHPSTPLQQPGQAAFAAIQEAVEALDADPHTDWSKISIDRLREHLIDMDEVTLHAQTKAQDIPGGSRIVVTGQGRTREAIERMVVSHAKAMGDYPLFTMKAEATPDGAVVTLVAKRPADVMHVRALGLIGALSEGMHHQMHHWMIVTGQMPGH